LFKIALPIILLAFLYLPFFYFVPPVGGAAEDASPVEVENASPVYIVTVKGEIAPAWLLYFERSLAEAQAAGAQALVLIIDTPGGYADTVLQARGMLQDFPAPVYAYVNQRALSAGAYLALLADYLYMAPGATLGAAEPRVFGSGAVADEKFLSFWEAEMRSAAEMHGRDPRLAAAMVRREMEIEGVVEAGKLLTLTAKEGERLGFTDGTAASLQELLELAGISGSPVVRTSPTPWEQLGGWLINPIVATVILSLAFLFLAMVIFSAGFGVAGLLSILSFGLYFGGHLFTGVSGWPAVFLFIFGVVLILAEMFFPGFGILGISGLVAVAAAIVLTAATAAEGLSILLYSFLLSAVFSYFAFRFFQRRGMLRRFVLLDVLAGAEGYTSGRDLGFLSGKEGIAITPLRPSGMVETDGSRYDVVSEGSFIPAGAKVKIVKVEGIRVVVRELKGKA